ncbi:thermostable hemolysin [Sedimenticola hydrogenitrophicus]|uniref:thermostable hemolysin n=1 Tax=Sedimenticola hydrogenitrophicus TaxID=2967975 RepID=UPI0021A4C0BF|nr:thermostable hemolysin [Sedimenticola hydrogenitrophicus]
MKQTLRDYRSPGSAVPTQIGLRKHQDKGRVEAEQFVRDIFYRLHNARVTQFMPILMDLRDDAGELLGVLGLREATDTELFLEHYLEQPVERVLGVVLDEPVERHDIVEVGNLAVASSGGGRWLITALTSFLYAMHRGWVVFTCGPTLRNSFRRMGIRLHDLGPANPDRLSATEAARWGRYYEQSPRVMASRVSQAYQVLAVLFDRECALNALWQCAAVTGGRTRWI